MSSLQNNCICFLIALSAIARTSKMILTRSKCEDTIIIQDKFFLRKLIFLADDIMQKTSLTFIISERQI